MRTRIEYCGALYHVTSRGDRLEAIFDDDQDRKKEEKWSTLGICK